MAHMIETNDATVFVGQPAWHGKGTVLPSDYLLSPAEAIARVLPWEPTAVPVLRADTGAVLTSHKAIVRSDDLSLLGLVTDSYNIIHNATIGRLAEYIGGLGCTVETAGSFRAGKRVWMLLRDKGSDWEAVAGDPVNSYVLVTTGHDGTLALVVTPTGVRVVCNNTHSLALARAERCNRGGRWLHKGVLDEAQLFDEVRTSIMQVRDTTAEHALAAKAMARKSMTTEQVQMFFTDVYSRLIDTIPLNPITQKEVDARADAAYTIGQWCRNMDHKKNTLPGMRGTLWAGMNAITQWACHERRTRGDRAVQNLMGGSAQFVADTIKLATAAI